MRFIIIGNVIKIIHLYGGFELLTTNINNMKTPVLILALLLATKIIYAQSWIDSSVLYKVGDITMGREPIGESGGTICCIYGYHNKGLYEIVVTQSNGKKFTLKVVKPYSVSWNCRGYLANASDGKQTCFGFCLQGGKDENGKDKMMMYIGDDPQDYSSCLIFRDLKVTTPK